jgi:hypothetical protein
MCPFKLAPPGVAQLMLARQLTTIVPAMTLAEASETTRIHSVAGLTGDRMALVTTRLCRAPHQTLSDAGLIGGGHVPMPGEVSLAHNGVLFLDELPEFRRYVWRSCGNRWTMVAYKVRNLPSARLRHSWRTSRAFDPEVWTSHRGDGCCRRHRSLLSNR